MFAGFSREQVRTSGAAINTVYGGEGPPVLLLHGFPQTHVMWHRVAPLLAESFTVVCTDLRGHGGSEKPPGGTEHRNYSKAVMARDQLDVMASLGHERFFVAGHDRGARVAHRLALEFPQRVTSMALLDVTPISFMMDGIDQASASANYHWFFLTQPYDLPERLIAADPAYFVRWHLRAWSGGDDSFFDDVAVAAYVEAFSDPATIHATTEDIRALMSIDLDAERNDRGRRRFECPLLVLWGARGKSSGLLEPWREWADRVEGAALDCGHWLAEERPEETAAALARFFT